MMEIFINTILAVLSAYIVYDYYKTFFKVGERRITYCLIVVFYLVWQILSMPSVSNIPAVVRLILSILFIVVFGVRFVGPTIGKVVFAIIYNAMWMLIELLVSAVFLNFGIAVGEYDLLGSFLCELTLLVLIKLLSCFFCHDSIRNFALRYNCILLMLPMGCMFCAYHLFRMSAKSSNRTDLWIAVIACIVMLVITSFMFLMYLKMADNFELKRKNDIFRLELELHTEHLKEKEAAMLEFRKSKHDLKHKLMYLSELSKKKEYEKLDIYIDELADLKSMNGFIMTDTNNSFIDALINYKRVIAKRNNITFNTALEIPENMPFDNADLYVILGNALDNAIEANMKQEIEHPQINLNMKYDRGNLIIILENTFDGVLDKDWEGKTITRKKNKENHGFGISSIKNSLKKYNGYLDIRTNDNVFCISIIMYPPQ